MKEVNLDINELNIGDATKSSNIEWDLIPLYRKIFEIDSLRESDSLSAKIIPKNFIEQMSVELKERHIDMSNIDYNKDIFKELKEKGLNYKETLEMFTKVLNENDIYIKKENISDLDQKCFFHLRKIETSDKPEQEGSKLKTTLSK